MTNFFAVLLILSLIKVANSFTCNDGGNTFRDIRFNETKYSYCYHIPTDVCGYGTFIPLVNHTCRLLSVKVTNHSLVTPNYLGSERCGCIDAVYGGLVIMVDSNPSVVTDQEWRIRIVDSVDWFYHGVTQERVPGSSLATTLMFLHGSDYFETTNQEIYSVFSNASLVANPWAGNASSEATTYPCDAINHAIDILDAISLSSRSRRRLFYWGFSTPSLTDCDTGGRSFNNIATYAVRQTEAVNLDGIESTYGNFTECDWYQAGSDSDPTDSDSIQNRAVIGTLSDFICAIEATPKPTSPPSPPPTTHAPTTTASPTPPPTAVSLLPVTETPPPTPKPTSPVTPAPTTPAPVTHVPTTHAPTTHAPTKKPTAKPHKWWTGPEPTPKPTHKPTTWRRQI